MVKNIMDKNTEKIDLIKKVYSKTEYPKIIDTQFQQLGVISVNEQIEATTTVQQFFEYYNELFYDIPSYGDSNSHEYLVKTSGEYINFDQENEIIVALRAEITQLRKDLLQAEIEKAEALTGEKINLDVNDGVNEELAGREQYNIITSAIPADPTTSNSNASSVSGTGTSGGGY
jgi:hypothetical protein